MVRDLQCPYVRRKKKDSLLLPGQILFSARKQLAKTEDLFRGTIENAKKLRRVNDDSFYPEEYSCMLAQMKRILEREKEISLAKLLRVSEIADKALYTQVKNRDMQNRRDLIQRERYLDLRHERFKL